MLRPDEGPTAPHPVIFDELTIKAAALRTFGSAGPSGIDENGWKRLCSSFHGASRSLCDAVAAVARRLATSYVDPDGLAPLTACRLCPRTSAREFARLALQRFLGELWERPS